jgi:signal-transduction protein with cAMP-binding, CBS, and nucleotidyltransferase domain
MKYGDLQKGDLFVISFEGIPDETVIVLDTLDHGDSIGLRFLNTRNNEIEEFAMFKDTTINRLLVDAASWKLIKQGLVFAEYTTTQCQERYYGVLNISA